MADDLPDLPPGYTLEQAQTVAPNAMPDLPPGYSLEQSRPSLSPSQTILPIGASLLQGPRDIVNSGAMLLAHGLRAMAPAGSSMEKWANGQIDATAQANAENEREYNKITAGLGPAGPAARTLGSIGAAGALMGPLAGAATLPGRLAGGMVAGGASGALQPVQPGTQDYWGDVAKNTLEGAGLGGASTMLLGAASRMVNPNAVNRLGPLLQAGVTPTMGQTAGGMLNRLEQAATSIPIIGDVIKGARARPFEQFGRGAINETLSPIGESLDPATPMGREAIQEMQDKAKNAYNQLLPGLTWSADPKFATDATNLYQMSKLLPAGRDKDFENIFRKQVLDNISPAGKMTGETFKDAESTLGQEANNYTHSSLPDDRKYGNAVMQLQALMRDSLARSNPNDAQQLAANNLTWANMKRVQRAASYTGAAEGQFSPAQLLASVKAQTPESSFAAGRGLMQPYAEAGKRVLGSTLPDSGTPYRGMLPLAAYAGVEHPQEALYALGGLAGTAGMYSPPTQWLLSRILGARPQIAAPAAQGLRNLSPYAAAAAPQAFGSLAP